MGKWIDKHHVGKHFELTFENDRFTWSRTEEKIREEAALDGLYVIRTSDDLPVQTFRGLLGDLGTFVKNMMQAGKDEGACFAMLTRSTPFQQKALDLLGVALNP